MASQTRYRFSPVTADPLIRELDGRVCTITPDTGTDNSHGWGELTGREIFLVSFDGENITGNGLLIWALADELEPIGAIASVEAVF